MEPTKVLLVGLPERVEAIALVLLEALGADPLVRRSAETAAKDARRAEAVVAALRLPGESGWSFLCDLGSARPRLRALLHEVPLGFAPGAVARAGVELQLVSSGDWVGPLVDALQAIGLTAGGDQARLVQAIRTAGVDPLQALLDAPQTTAEVEALALRYAAAAFPADQLLSLMMARLGAGPGEDAHRSEGRAELAIELLEPLGRAGFQALAELAGATGVAPRIRSRAMRSIAERFELSTAWPVLAQNLDDGAAWVRSDAARMTLTAAQEAGAEGLDLLLGLARSPAQPVELRQQALRAAAELATPGALAEALTEALAALAGDAAMAALTAELSATLAEDADQALQDALQSQDPSARSELDALRSVAARLSAGQLAPLLLQAQRSGDPARCSLALELAFSRGIVAAQPSWAKLGEIGERAERAALYGIMQRQRGGLPALTALAADPACSPTIRAAAIRLLAARAFTADTALFLESLLETPAEELQSAIRWASRALGAMGDDLLRGMAARSPSATARERALQLLSERSAPELMRAAVRTALADPAPRVRAAAVTAITVWMNAQPEAVLDQLLKLSLPGVDKAAAEAATRLEQAGFQIAAYLVVDRRIQHSVRRKLMSWLKREHPAEDVKTLLEQARAVEEAVLSDQTGAPSGSPSLRALLPGGLPRTHGAPLPPRSAPVDDTIPTPPAHAPTASLGQDPGAASAPAPSHPSHPPGPNPASAPDPDATWATGHPAPPAGADAGARASTAPRAAAGAAPELPVDLTAGLTLPPTTPMPPAGVPMSEPRARERLRMALGQGRAGYEGLAALAESDQAPEPVRVEALKHLAGDFPDREVLPLLERALLSDSEARTAAALSCLMVRDDARLEPFARMVRRPEEALDARLRAARFIARRFPIEAVGTLESLLDDPSERLRRVALEGLFTAVRFTPSGQVEGLLIQLIGPEHRALVRRSAARSLSAFGASAGREALLKAAEQADPELAQAFRSAAAQIIG